MSDASDLIRSEASDNLSMPLTNEKTKLETKCKHTKFKVVVKNARAVDRARQQKS